MFSGKKRKADKAVPQWKLDAERAENPEHEDAEREYAAVLRTDSPQASDEAHKAHRPAASACDGGGTSHEHGTASSTLDLPADDDDDDDNFDPSNYEIDDSVEEKVLEGDDTLTASCVYVRGVPHECNGDDLKKFFESCGSVVKVLRSVDVREKTAFISFDSPLAARRAVARSGAALAGEVVTVQPAGEPDGRGVTPMDELGATRTEQLALLDMRSQQPAELAPPLKEKSFAYMPGKGHRLPASSAPTGRMMFSRDFNPGRKEARQGSEAMGKPSASMLNGGWQVSGRVVSRPVARRVVPRHRFPWFDSRTQMLPNGERLPPNIDPSIGDWKCSCGNWSVGAPAVSVAVAWDAYASPCTLRSSAILTGGLLLLALVRNWARRASCNKCNSSRTVW